MRNIDTKYMTPLHYQKEYPAFLKFMNAYFDWSYGHQGVPEKSLKALLSSGADRADIAKAQANLTPGRASQELLGNRLLEREFESFVGLDGLEFEFSDGRKFETSVDNSQFKDSWLDDLGSPFTSAGTGNTLALRDVDKTRLVKQLAHIYSIRGTTKAAELFFNLYHKGAVEVTLPRDNISKIDHNFTLDGNDTIRDDQRYSEFSYVIRVKEFIGTEVLQELIEVYKEYIHPSGFGLWVIDDVIINSESAETKSLAYKLSWMLDAPNRIKPIDVYNPLMNDINTFASEYDKLTSIYLGNMSTISNGIRTQHQDHILNNHGIVERASSFKLLAETYESSTASGWLWLGNY
ncbi:head closure Hc2 [Vibrio phage K469]